MAFEQPGRPRLRAEQYHVFRKTYTKCFGDGAASLRVLPVLYGGGCFFFFYRSFKRRSKIVGSLVLFSRLPPARLFSI